MADRSNISLNAYFTEGLNIGTGTTVYYGKSDVNTLAFKTISTLGSGLVLTGDDNNIVISGSSEFTPVWGGISGTLSNQTDLNNVLDGKTNNDDFTGFTATTSTLTIDNLTSNILNYNQNSKTFEPYSAITTNVGIYTGTTCPTGLTSLMFNGILTATELRVSTGITHSTHNIGDIFWNDDDYALSVQQSADVSLQVGQELYVHVKNNTPSGINNGSVVFIENVDVDKPTIALARASFSDSDKIDRIIGLATEDIPAGGFGFITTFGILRGLDTSGLGSVGDVLYVSTTVSGGTTSIRPTPPDYAIKVGIIIKSDGIDGKLLVRINNATSDNLVYMTGGTNGLTTSGDNVKLGGTLTEDTTIDGAHTLSITGGSSLNIDTALKCCNLTVLEFGKDIKIGPYALNDTSSVGADNNIAIGSCTLYINSLGSYNTAIGRASLSGNTIGSHNIGIGFKTLQNNSSGLHNIAQGCGALFSNDSGCYNVGVGGNSLYSNTSGDHNVGIGLCSLYDNTTGSYNVANGSYALLNNTTGSQNTTSGYQALYSNSTGNQNTADGSNALKDNTSGCLNTSSGYVALQNNTTGCNNTANGAYALFYNEVGKYNTASGDYAGYSVTGSSSVFLGTCAGYNETEGCRLHIGNNQSCTLIYGEFDNKVVCSCGVFYPISYNCVDAACSGLPLPSAHTGGMIFVADVPLMAWSNGTDWLDFIDNNPI